jgi:hypothetical protein
MPRSPTPIPVLLSGLQVRGDNDAALVIAHRAALDVLVPGFAGVLEQVDEADLGAVGTHQA